MTGCGGLRVHVSISYRIVSCRDGLGSREVHVHLAAVASRGSHRLYVFAMFLFLRCQVPATRIVLLTIFNVATGLAVLVAG